MDRIMKRRTDADPCDTRFEHGRLFAFENGVNVSPRLRLDWPHTDLSYESVAADGFIYTPTATFKDTVTCFKCNKKEKNLIGVNSVASLHYSNHPECTSALFNHCLYLCRTNWKTSTFWKKLVAREECPNLIRCPVSDDSTSLRISTFKGHWKSCTPGGKLKYYREMAQAGFFFAPRDQNDDRVICIYCGCALDRWDMRQDPLNEHKVISKHFTDLGSREKCYFLAILEDSSDVEMVCAAESGDTRSENLYEDQHAHTQLRGTLSDSLVAYDKSKRLSGEPSDSEHLDGPDADTCVDNTDEDAMSWEKVKLYENSELVTKRLCSKGSPHVCRDQPRTSELKPSKIDALRQPISHGDPHSFADNENSPILKVSNGIASRRESSASVLKTPPVPVQSATKERLKKERFTGDEHFQGELNVSKSDDSINSNLSKPSQRSQASETNATTLFSFPQLAIPNQKLSSESELSMRTKIMDYLHLAEAKVVHCNLECAGRERKLVELLIKEKRSSSFSNQTACDQKSKIEPFHSQEREADQKENTILVQVAHPEVTHSKSMKHKDGISKPHSLDIQLLYDLARVINSEHTSLLSARHDLAQEQLPFEIQKCDAVEMHSTRALVGEATNTHPAMEAVDIGEKRDFEISEDSHKPSVVENACHKSSQNLATQAIGFSERADSMPASVINNRDHRENRSKSSPSLLLSSAQSISASLQQVSSLCLSNLPARDMRFEELANFVSYLRSLGYKLHNDEDGRLTSFLAEIPDNEKNMTIEEWHGYTDIQLIEQHEQVAESVGQSFDNQIDEVMSIIANYDPEMDLTEILEWANQLYDSHV